MLPLDKCSGCTACTAICPIQCIEMKPDNDGFLYPQIDVNHCIHCGRCEKICPILNDYEMETRALCAYSAKSNDDYIRHQSSSGGLFSVFAEWIIEQEGVVYGAAISEDHRVVHRSVETVEELACLRGSKYVSSFLGNIFFDVRRQLNTGRAVLFSGTPCQVEGLLAFLGRSYSNLLTIDVICHGVPSAKVWEAYVDCRERVAGSKIRAVNFRSKDTGWKDFSMKIFFENETEYSKTMKDDPFLCAFLSNLCLRKSCHNCAFKKKYRKSDITLADFWGIDEVKPDDDDNMGTSLVLVHTNRGHKVLQSLDGKVSICNVDSEIAISHNSAMIISVPAHHFRDYFFYMLGKYSFDKLVESCFYPTYLTRLHRLLVKHFHHRVWENK